MDIISFLVSILVGLITGFISSWYVSERFEQKAAKEAQKTRFEDDKQQLKNFILHVFDELVLIEQGHETSRLVWIIGGKPFCNSLYEARDRLKETDAVVLEQIDDTVEEIREFCFIREVSQALSENEESQIIQWTNALPVLARKVQFISNPSES